jgi:hypothetical protein
MDREVVVRALRDLLGPYGSGRWLVGAEDLAHGREEEPTTAHLLATMVCSEHFEKVGRDRHWLVEELQKEAAGLLEQPQDCRSLESLQVSAASAMRVLWESGDAASRLLKLAIPVAPAVAIEQLCGPAAGLWHQFRTGELQPGLAQLPKLAALPRAFDEQDVRALLAYLHAQVRDFALPGREGDPPGWRRSLEPMLEALPSLEGLRAWAQPLASPWKEGLLEGILRVETRRAGPHGLVGEGEPDWATLDRWVSTHVVSEAAVTAALTARGWYAGDLPMTHVRGQVWPSEQHFRDEAPEGRPDPLPPLPKAQLARVAELVAALPRPAPGQTLRGPPDYLAVGRLVSRWGPVHVGGHLFDFELGYLQRNRPRQIGTGCDKGLQIEAEHRGGSTSVWLASTLLARDMVSFLEVLARAPSIEPLARDAAVAASSIDARGDEGLAAWLAALPPLTEVVDLRERPTPVSVPSYRGRCGEVVITRLPKGRELALLEALQGARSVEELAARTGLHPIALSRRLSSLERELGYRWQP